MIEWSEYVDVWRKVKRAARTTINKDGEGVYPSDAWKRRYFLRSIVRSGRSNLNGSGKL